MEIVVLQPSKDILPNNCVFTIRGNIWGRITPGADDHVHLHLYLQSKIHSWKKKNMLLQSSTKNHQPQTEHKAP